MEKREIFLVILLMVTAVITSVAISFVLSGYHEEEPVTISPEAGWNPEELFQETVDSTVTIYISDGENVSSQGSGFLYDKSENYIVTNDHVVSSNQILIQGGEVQSVNEIYVKYAEEEWSSAEIVGSDAHTDLAVLEAETVPEDTKELKVREGQARVGEEVMAVGSPGGRERTLTTGRIISNDDSMRTGIRGFNIPDVISTDALLAPGSSGSPLIDQQGRVVGVNRALDERIGLAVSNRIVNHVVPSLIETGNHDHPLLGVESRNMIPPNNNMDRTGALVVGTLEGTNSHEKLIAGDNISSGDLILRVDGERVHSTEDISSYLIREKTPGETVTLEVLRDGEKQQVTVELESRKEWISKQNQAENENESE